MRPILLGSALVALVVAAWKVQGPPQSDPYPFDTGDYRPAETVLREAAERAKKESKQVFVVISSSWCGPCKIFWKHLHLPEIWTVLDRNYV
ncbi:MAG: thioredoxin family protein, partial [Fimbriimonadaceae bacterium]|nr:thioredoxin family protein [Fimbriimonadaceae bacterium]